MQSPEAFVVGYNPVPTAGRVARARSQVKWNAWSLVFLVALVLGYHYLLPGGGWRQTLISFGVGFAIWLGFFIWRVVALRRARQALERIGTGEAFRIDHSGIHAAEQTMAWPQITDVKAVARATGDGPDFVVEHTGGRYAVPLSFLDAMPGSIDSALRAYSGGRRGMDLAGLDSLLS